MRWDDGKLALAGRWALITSMGAAIACGRASSKLDPPPVCSDSEIEPSRQAAVLPSTSASAASSTQGPDGGAITLRLQDGATMVWVAAGSFLRGSRQQEGESDERPQRMLRVSGFWIDRTEVTVARFRRCMEAGACTPAAKESACNLAFANRPEHPINCVRWDQADAYCRWAGARLPTEAEWEKAARGSEGQIYPWGNSPPSCSVVVWYDPDGGHGCGTHSTWPVGSKPEGASTCGALDMAGNVWEWVADNYDPYYYAVAPNEDPKGPDKGIYKTLRGGGWGHDAPTKQRSAARLRFAPANQTPGTGLRCASSESGRGNLSPP